MDNANSSKSSTESVLRQILIDKPGAATSTTTPHHAESKSTAITQRPLAIQASEFTLWRTWNKVHNFLATFVGTTNTLSIPITSLFGLPELFPGVIVGLSWWGIGVGAVCGLIFGYCVADKHDADNGLINRHDNRSETPTSSIDSIPSTDSSDIEKANTVTLNPQPEVTQVLTINSSSEKAIKLDDITRNSKITCKQATKNYLHYLSDIVNTLALVVAIVENTPARNFKIGYRLLGYGVVAFWSWGSNRQEYLNGIKSYEDENKTQLVR